MPGPLELQHWLVRRNNKLSGLPELTDLPDQNISNGQHLRLIKMRFVWYPSQHQTQQTR